MTGVWENAAGFVVAPLLLWLIAVGYGLLIERLLRLHLPNPLLVTTGFCAAVVMALAGYTTGIGDGFAVPFVLVPPALGLIMAGRQLPGRLQAGWPLLAALATYVLFDLSVIATGHWAWTGYNIENDSAYEMVLIAHLQAHGTAAVVGPPSTANTVVANYLATGYPLGSQSLLGVLSGLLGVSAAVLWQGFISAVAAVGTLAASTLSGRTTTPRLAAAAGFVAVAGALFYQFALQGAIKEVAVTVAILCALAAIRYAIISLNGAGAVVICAVPLAAILAIFNAAGLPYIGALVGAGTVALLVVHRQWPRRTWLRPTLVGVGAFGLLAIPALLTIGTFFQVARGGYSGAHPAAPTLGPLLRPLPLSELSGVWLFGDYRYPVPAGSAGLVTLIVTVIVFVLLVPAVWRMWRTKEPGPSIGLATMVVVLAVVFPRVVPYAQAKLLVIATPVVVLACLQALTGLRGRWLTPAAAGVGLVIAGTVLASDAIAYHVWPVAPVSRLVAMRQIGQRLGAKGPVLDSEFEQFAKYFMLPAYLIDGPDAPTPEALTLRTPAPEYVHSFDLNQETLPFVESFRYVLVRRSPVSSPPPVNYTLVAANRFYALWKRGVAPRVYAHLPLGGQAVDSDSRPACSAVRSLLRSAPRGARFAVQTLPPAYGYQIASASQLSPGWPPGGSVPGGVSTNTPGGAAKAVQIPQTARYRIWVQGNFPRTVTVTLDGRSVGSVTGSNTPGGWLSAGAIRVAAGRHILGVMRGGGGLGPGNGNSQAEIDAVALSAVGQLPRRTILPLAAWRTVCSAGADWIELIGPA